MAGFLGDEQNLPGADLHLQVEHLTADFDPDQFLASLPGKPGVYRMVDADERPLYVGKARDLKKRVSSYFRPGNQLTPKIRTMVARIARIDITVTHTEGEALLLESNLIKELSPRYNVMLRDDKTYPYIYLSSEQEFPRLAFHRGARRGRGRYFGPYPNAGAVRTTLNLLQKLFLIRQCRDSFFRNRTRPCLQYQIKRCTAPCVSYVDADSYRDDVRHAEMFLDGKTGEVIDELVGRMEAASAGLEFERAARYRDQIAKIRQVADRQYVTGEGGDVDVVAAAIREGVACVQVFVIRGGRNLGNRSFFPRQADEADAPTVLRAFLGQYYLVNRPDREIPGEVILSDPVEDQDAIAGLLGAAAGRKVRVHDRVRGDRARWVQMALDNARLALGNRIGSAESTAARLARLAEALGLAETPERIECFDVSHTRGESAVASCVVFSREGPVKSEYRRFNIKDITPGDDYAAMQQALTRRYGRVKREEGRLPDILLVDGGKGQLQEAIEVLDELQVEGVTLVGVAKGAGRRPGLETLFLPARREPLQLAPDSRALHLLQRVRDEAHRFAITGHRGRRARARTTSTLEELPGVGPKRRQRLLQQFGGLQGLSRAGVDDLAKVPGISQHLARSIYDALHPRP